MHPPTSFRSAHGSGSGSFRIAARPVSQRLGPRPVQAHPRCWAPSARSRPSVSPWKGARS